MWPDMRLPLNTRPGVWRWPMEPGARCDTELPWVFMPPAKLWRFMVPAKPLPTVVPVTSTIWPALNMSTFSSPPDGQRLAFALVQAEFLRGVAGGDIGLGEMAGQRLGDPRRAAGCQW